MSGILRKGCLNFMARINGHLTTIALQVNRKIRKLSLFFLKHIIALALFHCTFAFGRGCCGFFFRLVLLLLLLKKQLCATNATCNDVSNQINFELGS